MPREKHEYIRNLSNISRKDISLAMGFQSCCQDRAIREIDFQFDPYMFVVTNNLKGLGNYCVPFELNENL